MHMVLGSASIVRPVAEWVQSNGERWSAEGRTMLLPHAPVFSREKLM